MFASCSRRALTQPKDCQCCLTLANCGRICTKRPWKGGEKRLKLQRGRLHGKINLQLGTAPDFYKKPTAREERKSGGSEGRRRGGGDPELRRRYFEEFLQLLRSEFFPLFRIWANAIAIIMGSKQSFKSVFYNLTISLFSQKNSLSPFILHSKLYIYLYIISSYTLTYKLSSCWQQTKWLTKVQSPSLIQQTFSFSKDLVSSYCWSFFYKKKCFRE